MHCLYILLSIVFIVSLHTIRYIQRLGRGMDKLFKPKSKRVYGSVGRSAVILEPIERVDGSESDLKNYMRERSQGISWRNFKKADGTRSFEGFVNLFKTAEIVSESEILGKTINAAAGAAKSVLETGSANTAVARPTAFRGIIVSEDGAAISAADLSDDDDETSRHGDRRVANTLVKHDDIDGKNTHFRPHTPGRNPDCSHTSSPAHTSSSSGQDDSLPMQRKLIAMWDCVKVSDIAPPLPSYTHADTETPFMLVVYDAL